MSEKPVFTEHKEIISRLREPFKFKIIPHRYETKDKLVTGHYIQVELNISPDDIDNMTNESGPVIQGIKNCIDIIENQMKSKYLGVK